MRMRVMVREAAVVPARKDRLPGLIWLVSLWGYGGERSADKLNAKRAPDTLSRL